MRGLCSSWVTPNSLPCPGVQCCRPLPHYLLKYGREDTHYLLFIWDKMRNELLRRGNRQSNLLLSVTDRSRDVCLRVSTDYHPPISSTHLPSPTSISLSPSTFPCPSLPPSPLPLMCSSHLTLTPLPSLLLLTALREASVHRQLLLDSVQQEPRQTSLLLAPVGGTPTVVQLERPDCTQGG